MAEEREEEMLRRKKAEVEERYQLRYVLWTRAIGKAPEDLQRGEDGEIARVTCPDSGCSLPWTLVYMRWISARWREWAVELGFKDRDGRCAHENALLAGRNRGETAFDPWLERWVERALAVKPAVELSEPEPSSADPRGGEQS